MGDVVSPEVQALQAAIAALDAEVQTVQAMSMSGSAAQDLQQNFNTQFAELEKDLEETSVSSEETQSVASVRCNRPARKMQAAGQESIFEQMVPTPPKSPRIKLSPLQGGMKKPPKITRGDAIDILNRLESSGSGS
jgi:hypothetical protein